MRRFFASTILIATCVVSHAADCEGVALADEDYDSAVKRVLGLPETDAWQHTHSFPVSFIPQMDKKQAVNTHCYWSVSVYAHRPERYELWQVFFVEIGGERMLISALNGDEIPLDQWRKTK